MIPYQVTSSENYEKIHNLSDIVSKALLDRRVPEPGQISEIFGKEGVKPYYLMHALTHSREYGHRKRVLDSGRRDQKPMQVHPFDSAIKPYFRLMDRKLPSGYDLTPRERNGVLVHDLGEEFGQGLLGALVVNGVIGYLVEKNAGKDADLQTNKNKLVFDPLGRSLNRLSTINRDSVLRILGRSEVEVKAEGIQRQYQRVLNALNSFGVYVSSVDYMAEGQKKSLLEIISEMSNSVLRKIQSGELLEPSCAAELIRSQYEHVMGIVEGGRYIEVDQNLVVPGYSEFLLTLNKTLYRDYVDNIARRVREDAISASQNGHSDDSSYLAPMMEKLADSTDTVIKMDHTTLLHDTNIFRKARILIVAGVELGRYLKEQQIAYRRLQRGVDYLFRNLDAAVNHHLRTLQEKPRVLAEEHWSSDLKAFELMKEKMDIWKRDFAAERKKHRGEILNEIVMDIINLRTPRTGVIYF